MISRYHYWLCRDARHDSQNFAGRYPELLLIKISARKTRSHLIKASDNRSILLGHWSQCPEYDSLHTLTIHIRSVAG